MTYTVAVINNCLRRGHCVGTFETIEEAQAYIAEEIPRTRSFVEFEIREGTPRDSGRTISGTRRKGEA